MTLLSGRRIVREALESRSVGEGSLVIADGYEEEDDTLNTAIDARAAEGRLFILKKGLYNELDIFNTRGPLYIAPVPDIPDWDGSLVGGCNLLVPFQDPVNVGSVIRSAAAFGVGRIVLLREAANPFHPRSVRASSGAVFGSPLFRGALDFRVGIPGEGTRHRPRQKRRAREGVCFSGEVFATYRYGRTWGSGRGLRPHFHSHRSPGGIPQRRHRGVHCPVCLEAGVLKVPVSQWQKCLYHNSQRSTL